MIHIKRDEATYGNDGPEDGPSEEALVNAQLAMIVVLRRRISELEGRASCVDSFWGAQRGDSVASRFFSMWLLYPGLALAGLLGEYI